MNVFALVLGVANGLAALYDYSYNTVDGWTLLMAFVSGGLLILGTLVYDREDD